MSLHQGRAIALLSLAAFASSVSGRLCDPMLPELAKSFSVTPLEVSPAVSVFALAYGLMQVFFGPLGDRIGKYRLIAYTTLASTLGTAAAALAGSLDALVLSRLLTGATTAGIIPLAMAWIGDTVAYDQRQATLAKFLGGQVMGVIVGQFVGGLFADTLGWRWAFASLSVVFLLVGGVVLAEAHSNPAAAHRPPAPTAATGLIAQASSVLRLPWARLILVTVFSEGLVVYGALAFVPSFLHAHHGLSLTAAGALMICFALGGLSYILAAPFFVSRLGEVRMAWVGAGLIALAWLLLAFSPHWGGAVPGCFSAGLGFYMLHNTLQTHATQMAPQVRGTAVSLFASSFFLGQSAGVAAGALLLARQGATVLFVAAALLIPVVGLGFSAKLRGRQRTLATIGT